MPAVWSGTISFSLVSVPVQLYATREDADPRLHTFHAEDGGRIRYRRVCEADGEEVALEDIARGVEVGGAMVVVTDQDLDDLPLADRKVITIDAFVPEDQIDPVAYRRAYYVVPQKAGIRPYALLRDVLRRAGRVAVVTFAMRDRESLAVLRTREDGVIVLESLYWPDEIRSVPFEPPEAAVADSELAAATDLIEAMSADFDPDAYHDRRREALKELIEAKVEGREVKHPPAPEGGGEAAAAVTDLMAALRASVDAAKSTRGASGAEKRPARKRTGKAGKAA
jgi:DNA end-binding protein Ku